MKKAPLFALLVGSLSCLLVFQNCTQPGIPDETNLKSEADRLDFAYDAKLNQIGYMSCSSVAVGSFDTSAYFSYRAGAYDNRDTLGLTDDNGGLRLTDTYLNYVSSKTPDGRWGILAESKANAATVMQLAIRGSGNLQAVVSSSGAAKSNEDFQNLLEELGPTGISKALVELPPGRRLRYLTNGSVYGSRMEASIYFTESETMAESVRSGLNQDNYSLGLTFTDMASTGSNEHAARSHGTVFEGSNVNPNRNVYGRGYHLRFTKIPNSHSSYPSNVLQAVTEQDYSDLSDRQGTWNCGLRFKIIRAEDAATFGCAMNADPAVPAKDLKLARNILKHEDWYIDMSKMCIVPKKNGRGCYGDYKYIQYDLARECTPNPATNNATVDANMACMAYASICYRSN